MGSASKLVLKFVLVPGTKYEYEFMYEAKKSEKYEVRGLSTSSYFSYLVLLGKVKEIYLIPFILHCMSDWLSGD
uniref:Uncharacterized protein n=1 Tax=Meloidogyne enterolobii TaxID=390850 RepID=A0A6V7V0D3_MELEN|nr:unnamed protein product [Meloidogyne enterolobii]